MSGWPTWTGSGLSVFDTDRWAAGFTVVFSVAVLLGVSGSGSFAPTDAVSVMVPACEVVTTMVTVAVSPPATDPRLQVTVPPARLQLPWLLVEDTYCVVGSSWSVSVTPVAVPGPLFVTVIVYVTSSPASTGSGLSA